MKIINIESGRKNIYVQRKDLKVLLDFKKNLPLTLKTFIFNNLRTYSEELQNGFEKFSDESEIIFLESLDWIVDFREIKDLSEQELLDRIYLLEEQLKNIRQTKRSQISKSIMIVTIEEKILNYKINSLKEALSLKKGTFSLNFPIVPDYKGFVILNEESNFIAQQGLNPLQLLIYKKDGTLFLHDDIIPEDLLDMSSKELVLVNLENNEFFGDYKSESFLTNSRKYFVTTLIQKEITKANSNSKITIEKPKMINFFKFSKQKKLSGL